MRQSIGKKAQLDIKGMMIKYILAFFFVTITVLALSQIGMIGKITPGGGVSDLGIMEQGITAAAVVEQNNTEVNETAEADNGESAP